MTELKGRDALKVRALAGLHPYNESSKLNGSFYRRFSFDNKAFIAHSEDSFCKAFDNGEIYSIDLDSNDEGQLSLANFTTIIQELGMAKTEQLLKSYILTLTAPVAMSEELLASLQ